MQKPQEQADFELIKYDHDRGHEVELNKFTHALEMEQLKLLILLNGGAATAILAFADKAGLVDRLWALLPPVFLWLLGLSIGAWATITLRQAQSDYARFYRHRRSATEWRQLAQLPREALVARIGRPPLHTLRKIYGDDARQQFDTGDGAHLHDRAATYVLSQAQRANRHVYPLTLISLAMFVLGALMMAAMMTQSSTAAVAPMANSSGTH